MQTFCDDHAATGKIYAAVEHLGGVARDVPMGAQVDALRGCSAIYTSKGGSGNMESWSQFASARAFGLKLPRSTLELCALGREMRSKRCLLEQLRCVANLISVTYGSLTLARLARGADIPVAYNAFTAFMLRTTQQGDRLRPTLAQVVSRYRAEMGRYYASVKRRRAEISEERC